MSAVRDAMQILRDPWYAPCIIVWEEIWIWWWVWPVWSIIHMASYLQVSGVPIVRRVFYLLAAIAQTGWLLKKLSRNEGNPQPQHFNGLLSDSEAYIFGIKATTPAISRWTTCGASCRYYMHLVSTGWVWLKVPTETDLDLFCESVTFDKPYLSKKL